MQSTVFNLPPARSAKADPTLIGVDLERLTTVALTIEEQRAEVQHRLDALRLEPAGSGRKALDRDLEIHHLSSRLSMLNRFGPDVCLGRMVPDGGGTTVYIGRIGLTGRDGEPLLIDWRAPAAEPFFAATHAAPAGLATRRRYRWRDGQIVDYWDEVFSGDLEGNAALDDQSSFIASLARSRTSQMRDVLATIAVDQDAIIRSDADGALVVDGGPGTGKTVVALHRAAYLLYEDPRLGSRGGVLVIGPHRPYLRYVADVLPNLGEDGVAIATLDDLVPQGESAVDEADPVVARLKSSARLVDAVDAAVAFYEDPPTDELSVETRWSEVEVEAADWKEAFEAPDPGTPHNEARDLVWDALLDILVDKHGLDGDLEAADVRDSVGADDELRDAFTSAWPILHADDLVSDLWSVPAYLRLCAPWLGPDERAALRRPEGSPWTKQDLPLLDAMRRRLGDPHSSGIRRQREAALAENRSYMDEVVADLLASNDDPESPLPYLNRESIREALVDEDVAPHAERDRLAGPFGHVIVDEAQELSDAQWQMVLARCPSRSVTVVGDRTQARDGFPESWEERLGRVGFGSVTERTLTLNYRTPRQVMEAAEPVIRAVLPDANVPESVRDGAPVRHGTPADLDAVVETWLATHDEGVAVVVGAPDYEPPERVSSLAPELTKGLEFDLVVLVRPEVWGEGVRGAVDRYVAMTRATSELVILG